MRKDRQNKGFTLAELLIVVAIIGVLVSISIPIFTGQLEKARQATDLSNMRSAKAAAVADYLVNGYSSTKVYNYDAETGMVTNEVPNGYGKSKSLEYNSVTYQPIGKYVRVTINGDDSILTEWSGDENALPSSGGDGGVAGTGGTPSWSDLAAQGNEEAANVGSDETIGGGSDEGTGDSGSSTTPSSDTSDASAYLLSNNNYSTWEVVDIQKSSEVNIDVKAGDVFSYDGDAYVAAGDIKVTFNEYYQGKPGEGDYQYSTIKVSNNPIKTNSDTYDKWNNGQAWLNEMSLGDIYFDGTDYYIFKSAYDSEAAVPSVNGNYWQKITMS